MLFAFFFISAFSHYQKNKLISNDESGQCGDDITWNFNNRRLALTGTGAMYQYEYDDLPWKNLLSDTSEISISEGITELCNVAFRFTKIKTIEIPNSITAIGDRTFAESFYLVNVTIGSSTSQISTTAFQYCFSLNAFFVNESSEYFTAQNGVLFSKNQQELVKYPTHRDQSEPYIVPESVTKIYDYAFQDARLSQILLPDNLTSIGIGAFSSMQGLTSIKLPNQILNISTRMFLNCNSLKDFECNENVEIIDDSAFSGCKFTSFKFGPNISKIGQYAFGSVPLEGKIEIGTSPESSICTIGYHAFSRCENASEVILGPNIVYIDEFAFAYCHNLVNFTKLPDEKGQFKVVNDYLFISCKSLTTVVLPFSVEKIGGHSFLGCNSLTRIELPSNLKVIGLFAFNECTNLPSFNATHTSLEYIGIFAFANCSRLESLVLPGTINSIQRFAFDGCINLKSFEISMSGEQSNYFTSVDGILYNYNMTSLISYPPKKSGDFFVIPKTVKTLKTGAFSNSYYLTNLTIQSDLDSVNIFAIYGCSKLSYVLYEGTEQPWFLPPVFYSNPKLKKISVYSSYKYRTFCGFPVKVINENKAYLYVGIAVGCVAAITIITVIIVIIIKKRKSKADQYQLTTTKLLDNN